MPFGGFPGTGPTPGSTALDGPPPSPTPMGEADLAGPFSMRGLAGGGSMPGTIPATGLPPEVLTGVQQAVAPMDAMLDSLLQVTPDQAQLIALMKQLLQQYLGNIQQAGGGPTSPTATGAAFPGGGIDRGLAGAGAI